MDEAVAAGARRKAACDLLGLDRRTLERWRREDGGEDRRQGPTSEPANKLSPAERKEILDVANRPEFRDLSPKQIVPRLADQDTYIASESSFYRVLRAEDQLAHRQRSRPRQVRKPETHVATGPCQVLTWDITYLASAVRGQFYYLYMFVDIWSRKIVGWDVHEDESMDHASTLVSATAAELGVDPRGLLLHSDNGGPMKGSTMLATLQRLGIVPSFSRPRVSDDNAYSEALFRTLKYRPEYPHKPFASLAAARAWVSDFVAWYNNEHLHSSLRFVTPSDRHERRDVEILGRRQRVYARAHRRTPARWSRGTRNWEPIGAVHLNPTKTGGSETATS